MVPRYEIYIDLNSTPWYLTNPYGEACRLAEANGPEANEAFLENVCRELSVGLTTDVMSVTLVGPSASEVRR